jgi:hypothetical protein
LPERSGRRISRIGEYLVSARSLGSVELFKILMPKVDLAANVDHIRNVLAFEHVRNLADRLDIRRNVLGFRAIAPRRRLDENARLVAD